MKCFHALFPVFLGMWVSVGSSKRTGAVLRVQLLLLETVSYETITYIRDPQHINTSVFTQLQHGKKHSGDGQGAFKKNTLKQSYQKAVKLLL